MPFRELSELEGLLRAHRDLVRSRVVAEVEVESGAGKLPIHALTIGTEDPTCPTFGIFGGVHGIERIGARVVLAYLASLLERLRWDAHARRRFDTARLVSIPIVNPGGMARNRRANPRGVDLMRNAPVEALERSPWPLRGQRLSPWLPFYRGPAREGLQPEAQALVRFVEEEMFPARAAISLDVHSGFGWRDRLWYPYARSSGGFPRAFEARNLATLLDGTYPANRYLVEPQSVSYTTHGDLWDYLFDLHLARHGLDGPPFVPWTLEMGSWNWVRKNPRQLLTWSGLFNPTVPHRLRRVMRHHLTLADFFLRAAHNPAAWARRAL